MHSVLLNWFFGIMNVYIQGIIKKMIQSQNHLALKDVCSQEPGKPFSTVFEKIF